MSRAKWEATNLEPEPGYAMLPSLYDAMRYRGLLLYAGYDTESGGFWGNDWEVQSERTGGIIMTIRAEEGRAYEIATKLGEALNWEQIDEARWQTISVDPVFLAFMAEQYEEVAIPMVETVDFESVVPYSDRDVPSPSAF